MLRLFPWAVPALMYMSAPIYSPFVFAESQPRLPQLKFSYDQAELVSTYAEKRSISDRSSKDPSGSAGRPPERLRVAEAASSRATWVESQVAQVSIPNTRRLDFVSTINGHRYSISVAIPFEPVPAGGYGVLYVLDGYSYFGSATEAVRANAPSVVVVGIGYPDDPAYLLDVLEQRGPIPAFLRALSPSQSAPVLERAFDLSLPASNEELGAQSWPGLPKKSGNAGGLDDFLKIIETEVKPRVAALVPVNAEKSALFGHSLAGMAVIHALFVEPNAFRTFISVSASIWWNNRQVLADEGRFAAAVRSGRAEPRVFVAMGSEEDFPPNFPRQWEIDPNTAKAFYRKARMVKNGAELVTRLKALHGRPGYVVENYAIFGGQDHQQVPWSALACGIPFAFSAASKN